MQTRMYILDHCLGSEGSCLTCPSLLRGLDESFSRCVQWERSGRPPQVLSLLQGRHGHGTWGAAYNVPLWTAQVDPNRQTSSSSLCPTWRWPMWMAASPSGCHAAGLSRAAHRRNMLDGASGAHRGVLLGAARAPSGSLLWSVGGQVAEGHLGRPSHSSPVVRAQAPRVGRCVSRIPLCVDSCPAGMCRLRVPGRLSAHDTAVFYGPSVSAAQSLAGWSRHLPGAPTGRPDADPQLGTVPHVQECSWFHSWLWVVRSLCRGRMGPCAQPGSPAPP